MWETLVQSLVWEDPTCCRATKACVPQLLNLCSRAWELQRWSPHTTTTEACVPEPCSTAVRSPHTGIESSPCSQQLEISPCNSEDPAQPKINKSNNFLKLYENFDCIRGGHPSTHVGQRSHEFLFKLVKIIFRKDNFPHICLAITGKHENHILSHICIQFSRTQYNLIKQYLICQILTLVDLHLPVYRHWLKIL